MDLQLPACVPWSVCLSRSGHVHGQVPDTVDSDLGPRSVEPSKGILCCGAVPYVQNYNVRLATKDRRLASQITKAVREKDGGLPNVEALTLEHQDGNLEVACNLLDPMVTPPDKVLALASSKAADLGVAVLEAYTIGMGPLDILRHTQRQLLLSEVMS